MFFKVELQHQKRISLFIAKSAMQNFSHNVQVLCYCCVTWYQTRTTFFASLFSLEVKLLLRNAFAGGKGLGRKFFCACIFTFLNIRIL